MSDPVVGILGLICIIAVVVTLFRSKTQPAIAFIVFPAILGLILVLGGRYSFDNIATMIKSGLGSTGPTAVLFVFSVLYFGIMTDAGMFDVIIGKLMGTTSSASRWPWPTRRWPARQPGAGRGRRRGRGAEGRRGQ